MGYCNVGKVGLFRPCMEYVPILSPIPARQEGLINYRAFHLFLCQWASASECIKSRSKLQLCSFPPHLPPYYLSLATFMCRCYDATLLRKEMCDLRGMIIPLFFCCGLVDWLLAMAKWSRVSDRHFHCLSPMMMAR